MAVRTPEELAQVRGNINDWRKMSDRLFSVGGFGVGLDGLLTWIPGVGDAYTIGAGGYLLYQAVQAGASPDTLARMTVLLGADAVVGSVPLVGDAFDFVFRAHARASRVLLADIDRQELAALKALQAPPPYTPPSYAPPPRPAAPDPTPPPAPRPAPPPEPEDGLSEAELARRVEELRAEVRARGGGLNR